MNDSVPSGRASKSDELLALAARCEVEEGDWKLDDAIRQVVFNCGPCGTAGPPRYTTSLDAAVTLACDPWKIWELCQTVDHDGEPVWNVCLAQRNPSDSDFEILGGTAKTEPMARCAAYLRSRAAIASQESGESLRDPKALHHTQGR